MKPVTRALPLALLLTATHAHALGLGEARVASDLSSPLLVEIPLLNPGGTRVLAEEVQVDVPGFDEHARLGAPQPILPSQARIRVITESGGRTLVRITTRDATREPILRFLLRVTWQGRVIIREYQLLVDPPAIAMPRRSAETVVVSAPVSALRTRSARVPIAGASYGPIVDGDTLASIVTRAYPRRARDARRLGALIVERNPDAFIDGNADLLRIDAILTLPGAETVARTLPPARAPAPAPAPRRAPLTPPVAAVISDGTYTVRAGDTLYGIARDMGVRGVPLAVLVERLFEANPGAFLDGDRNQLRAGAVLSLDAAGSAEPAPERTSAAEPAPAEATPTPPAPQGMAPAPATEVTAAPTAPESTPAADVPLTVTPGELTALRDELASVEAAVELERSRESELRSQIDTVIQESEVLREREAQLTLETEALREQIARETAKTMAAALQSGAIDQAPKPAADVAAVAPSPATAMIVEETEPAAAAPADAATVERPPALPARRREPSALDRLGATLRRAAGDAENGSGLMLAGGGAAALALLFGLLMRKRRRSATAAGTNKALKPDEEAVQRRLAEVREHHEGLRTGDFTDEGEIVRTAEGRTVVMTDAARANNLAKEAAVHMAYGDLESSKACIQEAIRLAPQRDEHKMLLITVYESTNEHAKARAIVEDLLSRREQLPSEIRAQVEARLQDRAAG